MSDTPGFLSRLFISGSLAFVLIGIAGAVYGVALPVFTRIYGLDDGAAGFILSTNALGAVIAVLAATLGAPGLGARTALLLIAAGAGGIALMAGWTVTLAASLLLGAGFGLIATEVNRGFLAGFGARGPGMVGLVNGISGLGLVLGPLLFVWTGGSLPVVYGGLALFAAALAVVPVAAAPRTKAAGGVAVFVQWRMGILLLNHLAVCLESALSGLGVTALIAAGWTEGAAAGLAAGFFAAFLVTRLALYWITRVVPPDVLFLTGAIGTALSAALAASGFEAAGYVAAGAFVGLSFPSFFVWGARVLGDDPRMSAAILLSGLSGLAMGPFLATLLLQDIGMEMLFALVAAGAAVLSVAIFATMRPARRAMAGPVSA